MRRWLTQWDYRKPHLRYSHASKTGASQAFCRFRVSDHILDKPIQGNFKWKN